MLKLSVFFLSAIALIFGGCDSSSSNPTFDNNTNYYIHIKNAMPETSTALRATSDTGKVRVLGIMRGYENILLRDDIKAAYRSDGTIGRARITVEGNDSKTGTLQNGDTIVLHTDGKLVTNVEVNEHFLRDKRARYTAIDAIQTSYDISFNHNGSPIDTTVTLTAIYDVHGTNILNNNRPYINVKNSSPGEITLYTSHTGNYGIEALTSDYTLEFSANSYAIPPYTPTENFLTNKSTALTASPVAEQYTVDFKLYNRDKTSSLISEFAAVKSIMRDGKNLLDNNAGKITIDSSIKGMARVTIGVDDANETGLKDNDTIALSTPSYTIPVYKVTLTTSNSQPHTQSGLLEDNIDLFTQHSTVELMGSSDSTVQLMGSSDQQSCQDASSQGSSLGCGTYPCGSVSFDTSCGCSPDYDVYYVSIFTYNISVQYNQNYGFCSANSDNTTCQNDTNGNYEYGYSEYQWPSIGFLFSGNRHDGTNSWFLNNVYTDSSGKYVMLADIMQLATDIPGGGSFASCGELSITDNNIDSSISNDYISNQTLNLQVCLIYDNAGLQGHNWFMAASTNGDDGNAALFASCFGPSYGEPQTGFTYWGVSEQAAKDQAMGGMNCSCQINGTNCDIQNNSFITISSDDKYKTSEVIEQFQNVREGSFANSQFAEEVDEGGEFDDGGDD